MVSLVENSATAGVSGIHTFGENIWEAKLNLAPVVLALASDIIIPRIFLLCRMGTSDMNSTPPAITASVYPVAIIPMPVVMAWLDEMQACVTVWEGVNWEKPAPRAAYNNNVAWKINIY